jgi:hypothetical protein
VTSHGHDQEPGVRTLCHPTGDRAFSPRAGATVNRPIGPRALGCPSLVHAPARHVADGVVRAVCSLAST